MCGRFSLDTDRRGVIKRYPLFKISTFKCSEEIFPGTKIQGFSKNERLEEYYWGITVDFMKRKIINSRIEKIYESKFFKDDFEKDRILVPATSFFEWKNTVSGKDKYQISVERPIFSLAAIGRRKGRKEISLLTTEAKGKIQSIHHRMPIIVPQNLEEEYLYSKKPKNLQQKLMNLQPNFIIENKSDVQLSFL
ncbi:MAG: SOS response-associated peptidase family protein [Tissierellia bacterium]|nr:SOS response-associated peptidase family protein [Tissierellia bacterium]